jgi:hypothetical protein
MTGKKSKPVRMHPSKGLGRGRSTSEMGRGHRPDGQAWMRSRSGGRGDRRFIVVGVGRLKRINF